MGEVVYTDRRGLEIDPQQVDGWYRESGLSRQASEAAFEALGMESHEATHFLEIYWSAYQWYEGGGKEEADDEREQSWVIVDGFAEASTE